MKWEYIRIISYFAINGSVPKGFNIKILKNKLHEYRIFDTIKYVGKR